MKNRVVSFLIGASLVIVGVWYVFANHHTEIYEWLGVRETHSIYIDEAFFSVTVADENDERQKGLSGTTELRDQEGMLFIFDQSGRYGMWMKDMNYPIDIIWIDDTLRIAHIEEQVSPDSYPQTFSSPGRARFVLEVPAFSVETFKLQEGQRVTLPYELIPEDIVSEAEVE